MLRIHEVAMGVAVELRGELGRIKSADPALEDQLRRALMSVVNNISEGSGQVGRRRPYHYALALGSAREAWSDIRLAVAFGYVEAAVEDRFRSRFDHIIGTLVNLLPNKTPRRAS